MALDSIADPHPGRDPGGKPKDMPKSWVMRKVLGMAGIAGMAWAAGAAQSAAHFTAMDTLFLTAATGEPRLQAARDSSETILLARHAETVAYLLARNAATQTPRQRRYTEKLFGLLSDSGRKTEPGLALIAALASMPDSLKPHWLYIASTMGDKALGRLGLVYIQHSRVEVRCMAARVLGAYPDPSHAKALLANLDPSAEAERHQRLWALAAISSRNAYPGCESLSTYLSDTSLAVRQMAVSALAACVGKDFARLKPPPRSQAPNPGSTAQTGTLLAWVDLALAVATPESRAWADKAKSSLGPKARLFQGGVMYNDTGKP